MPASPAQSWTFRGKSRSRGNNASCLGTGSAPFRPKAPVPFPTLSIRRTSLLELRAKTTQRLPPFDDPDPALRGRFLRARVAEQNDAPIGLRDRSWFMPNKMRQQHLCAGPLCLADEEGEATARPQQADGDW